MCSLWYDGPHTTSSDIDKGSIDDKFEEQKKYTLGATIVGMHKERKMYKCQNS
eukprot:m.1683423 g.1683423  ORF g.1683423 m.1683423 type:complete len:53 (-) comp237767_c0_seq1:80-238(-)